MTTRKLATVLAGISLIAWGASACENGTTDPPPPGVEVAAVVSSVDNALTIFPVDDPQTTTVVGLGPEGSPVSAAARDGLAAVPLGVVPAVAVVSLSDAVLVRTIPLPAGSGATGIAYLDDEMALVGNPSLNSVTPVNVAEGTTQPAIPVGRFPQWIVVRGNRAFVLNAELDELFTPDGPATISVIDVPTLQVTGTITLTGQNAIAGAFGADGNLYVVNAGNFGAGDGSLSVVDPNTLVETEHHVGFGDFPGDVAPGPGGTIVVTSFSYGLAVWDPAIDDFLHSPDAALAPGGVASVSGVEADGSSRLHVLTPDCVQPGTASRLTSTFGVEATAAVGICPFDIVFTTVPAN